MLGQRAIFATLSLCIVLASLPVQAQNVDAFKGEFEDRLHQQGDSFVLCYNPDSVMNEFDQALAAAIGSALLTDVKTVPVESLPPHRKLDTAFAFTQDQIYILMAQQCDGMMGFVLAPGYDSWLTISRPYLISDNVFVSNDPNIKKLDDVPKDKPIGSRVGTDGDASLIGYNQALPENSRWKRFAYYDNDLLFNRLTDGTLGAGVIWEPVLDIATGGDPSAKGLHRIDVPFNVQKTQVGIGVRANDSYLKTELDDATKELVADGTVDKLLAQFHLSAGDTVPQTQQQNVVQ